MKIRRALFTVSDKQGVVELARALVDAGTEIIATGKTATVLRDAGLTVIPIETISGSPEAFQGRMKTLSFPVCSGILARRGDELDNQDLKKLNIAAIDCVVVNFYPFESAALRPGITRSQLIEEIDIGGPTLVRAAAKNSPDVLVLTHPTQYEAVIQELRQKQQISSELANRCAGQAWDRITAYDQAISEKFGSSPSSSPSINLRYGENPHQSARLDLLPDSPIAWDQRLTSSELSYNNILDVSSAYSLASDLIQLTAGQSTGVVILKHNNPCGMAVIPKSRSNAQLQALERAWEGDPISAFGGVLVFTDSIEPKTAEWLAERFVELVAAPELTATSGVLETILKKRKNLKALRVLHWHQSPRQMTVAVPGAKLVQTTDHGLDEVLRSVTQKEFVDSQRALALFGIAAARALKSNAIALVRELPQIPGAYQLVGAGQGQPNRIDALEKLAIPRALEVLRSTGGEMKDCVLISDAFFPFRDAVEAANRGGIRWIVQPGGSIKDAESIHACNEFGIAMAFTGIRHFKH